MNLAANGKVLLIESLMEFEYLRALVGGASRSFIVGQLTTEIRLIITLIIK